MSQKTSHRTIAAFAVAGAILLLHNAPAFGWFFNLYGCEKCPPPYHHCQEGPPRLKYNRVCPRPVCCPDGVENFGYFPTCWQPWPWAANCAHCPPYGPPAVSPLVAVPPSSPGAPVPGNVLPTPRPGVPGPR